MGEREGGGWGGELGRAPSLNPEETKEQVLLSLEIRIQRKVNCRDIMEPYMQGVEM